ncbi:MAG: beta-galactosidase [Chloroflexi bacterium]|nr:beta-galactosidase [Chloroflexota bacterium]
MEAANTLFRAFLSGALALTLAVAATLPVAAQSTTPSGAASSSFTYGAILNNLHDAPLARAAGFTSMSAYVSWKAIEPSRGQYIFEQKDQWGRAQANDLTNVIDAARANGLKVGLRMDDPPDWAGGAVYRLDPADIQDYLYHVVRYAAGSLAYVEVFNEMNLPLEWGTSPVDPAAYARILAGAYRGAKQADPNVVVVSAGPSQRTGGLGGTMEDVDWLNAFYDAGGNAYFDALGMHAYLGNYDPTTDPACTPMCFRDLELYRAVMVNHGDDQKRALITEFGTLEQTSVDLGQYAWMELPSDARADYLVQALHMATVQYTWLLGATVFNLDYATTLPSTSERSWFSMLNPDRSPRTAYTKFQQARASGYLA